MSMFGRNDYIGQDSPRRRMRAYLLFYLGFSLLFALLGAWPVVGLILLFAIPTTGYALWVDHGRSSHGTPSRGRTVV